ncbi:MAG: beta-propeller fold lactonase family protein, partial [Gammaproteobacteria bacterium]|nr:beta-propeller fold lactonase family protein [Gammaproteobacteria bacterium]
YAVDASGNQVSVYSIDASTGALTPISGSPFAAGNNPQYIQLDIKYGLAYVSNFAGHDISAYSINPATGALTPVTTGGAGACGVMPDPLNCFPAGPQPGGLAVGPSSYLYATNRNCASPPTCSAAGSISEWSINTSSGALTPISAGSCGTTPDPGNCVGAGIDPFEVADVSNAFVYSANVEGNDISGYSISSSNGALTPLSAGSCGVTPDPGNCFATVSEPSAVVGAPQTLIVANFQSNQISIYDVDKVSGMLTQSSLGSQYNADYNTQGLSIDPTDRFAYVTNGSGIIDIYQMDALTGALNSANGNSIASVNAVGGNLAIDPSGRYLYSPGGGGGNQVAAFSINPTGGYLNNVTGGSCGGGNNNNNCFPAGPIPQIASVDASGQFLYLANSNCASGPCPSQGSVSAYTIDSATGVLTAVTTGGAGSCGVSPDPMNCFLAGEFPYDLASDPVAGLVYAGNAYGNNLSGYQINSSTGALTGVAGSSCGTGLPNNCFAAGEPSSIVFTPSGSFAYATNYGADSISAFSVDSSTGVLTPINGTASCGGGLPSICFAAGNVPFAGAVTANGQYYIVANKSGNDVSVYGINSSTGVLTPVTAGGAGPCGVTPDPMNCFAAGTGTSPMAVSVDATGRFVYVANENCSSPPTCSTQGYVMLYTLDGSTGALTPLNISSPFPSGDLPFDVRYGP